MEKVERFDFVNHYILQRNKNKKVRFHSSFSLMITMYNKFISCYNNKTKTTFKISSSFSFITNVCFKAVHIFLFFLLKILIRERDGR